MSLEKLLLGFASAALVLTVSTAGQAQVCTSNADCRMGTTCQASAVPPAPASRPACGKEVDCGGVVTDPAAPETAVPTPVEMSCQAASCSADADCGAGMVCHGESVTTCSGGGTVAPCRPNTVCDQPASLPAPETCTTTTHSRCAYKWQLPCNSDVDCGAEFTCVPMISGTCSSGSGVSGGGSSGPSTGTGGSANSGKATAADLVAPGAPLPAADGGTSDPVCTTTTSFPGYCQPKATTCAVNADCPATWMCAEISTPAGNTATTGSGTAVDLGGGAPVPVRQDAPPGTTPATTAKVCQASAAFPSRGSVATDLGGPGNGEPPTTTGGGATAGERNKVASSGGCSAAQGTSRGASVFGLGALGLAAALLFRRTRRR